MAERHCGPCRLCCNTLAVPTLRKPAYQWCQHACDTGCQIYEERPPECRVFECLWLEGTLPLEGRPDKWQVVFTEEQEDDGTPLIVIYEASPGAAQSDEVLDAILQCLDQGANVVVRNEKESSKFFPDGSRYRAEIDQTDPLRMRVKDLGDKT